uniref:Ferritin n=2 Tax=Lepeophtheirus salmonis TaxID=72036 RepID=D3PHX6_LEPSM|nr:Ferritin light chain, oocyte isoform [Lepeophtheirus salmonis]
MIKQLLLLSILVASCVGGPDSCGAHTDVQCGNPGTKWESGICNSVFGGFKGNTRNLSVLINRHLNDSFKYLVMASYFDSAEVNRMGFNKYIQGYSDKLWDNGKDILKYVLSRGGSADPNLKVTAMQMPNYQGEVLSMSASLDMMKQLMEDMRLVYKHAANKHVSNTQPERESYDPPLLHYLEESFFEDYTERIRDLAGKLNILGKIARNDKTKYMGFHLFDKSM